MPSPTPLIPLSANPTAHSLSSPDLPSLLQSYFNACNAFDFTIMRTYLHPTCTSALQDATGEHVRGTSATGVMQGMAMGSVCMAPPFKPWAVIYEVEEVPVEGTADMPVKERVLRAEFSFHGKGGKEEDVGGRRAKVRYAWRWDGDGEGGLWKIGGQVVEDVGFEMKKGDWMGEYREFERARREEGKWLVE